MTNCLCIARGGEPKMPETMLLWEPVCKPCGSSLFLIGSDARLNTGWFRSGLQSSKETALLSWDFAFCFFTNSFNWLMPGTYENSGRLFGVLLCF